MVPIEALIRRSWRCFRVFWSLYLAIWGFWHFCSLNTMICRSPTYHWKKYIVNWLWSFDWILFKFVTNSPFRDSVFLITYKYYRTDLKSQAKSRSDLFWVFRFYFSVLLVGWHVCMHFWIRSTSDHWEDTASSGLAHLICLLTLARWLS